MTSAKPNLTGSLFMVMGPYPYWPALQEERLSLFCNYRENIQ
jgi:hypothetical protein